MGSKIEKEAFTQAGLAQRYQAIKIWLSYGWSATDLQALVRQGLDLKDSRLGSPAFCYLWKEAYGRKSPQHLLAIILKMAEMPEELSGELAENQALVGRFCDDLAPDHAFWQEFASLVEAAFSGQTLSQQDVLARQTHQFRYIISSQQAQWIRRHLKQAGMTDAQALARFLSKKKRKAWYRSTYDYSLTDSARLHNKLAFKDGKCIYPDNCSCVNFKVLLYFHTEFIIDSKGQFLNEADAEKISQNGVINGASFNYASSGNKRHWELDVNPAGRHDPLFREKMINQTELKFRAPKLLSKRAQKESAEHWQKSYFNKKGLYAVAGRSSYQISRRLSRQFQRKIWHFWWKRKSTKFI